MTDIDNQDIKEIGILKKFFDPASIIAFNIIGIFLYFPLLIVVGFSLGAPGSGEHWAHLYFVISNLLPGPLCLIALFSKKRRHWGVIGYGIAFSGWLVLMLICAGQSTCR